MEVTVYLKSGETLRFRQVVAPPIAPGDAVLSFSYVSASRGVPCQARFMLENIAGYSFDFV